MIGTSDAPSVNTDHRSISMEFPEKLRRLMDSKIHEYCKAESIPGMLFHYTNSQGLLGILASRSMWLTRIDCCNDPSERQIAYDILESLINDREARQGQTQSHLSRALALARDLGPPSSYITCFTELDDDLSQWRAYCSTTDGYCIGFSFADSKFIEINDDNTHYKIALARVIYDKDEQERLINWYLDLFIEATERAHLEAAPTPRGDWIFTGLCGRYFPILASLVKSGHYRAEKEWRLIRYVVHGYYPHDFLEPDTDLDFRASRLGVTPFVKVSTQLHRKELCQLPIRQIRQSPRYDSSLGLSALQSLIASKKIDAMALESEIPARW